MDRDLKRTSFKTSFFPSASKFFLISFLGLLLEFIDLFDFDLLLLLLLLLFIVIRTYGCVFKSNIRHLVLINQRISFHERYDSINHKIIFISGRSCYSDSPTPLAN